MSENVKRKKENDLFTNKTKFMATTSTNSHGGKHRLDHEIEKYRLELNWTKILDKLKSSKASGLNLLNKNE